MQNLFDLSYLDLSSKDEHFEGILKSDSIRIERIVSTGQVSPKDFWYDQSENEWVCILQGSAILSIKDSTGKIKKQPLSKGQNINLPAHTLHRVDYTDTKEPTIWLAVFY